MYVADVPLPLTLARNSTATFGGVWALRYGGGRRSTTSLRGSSSLIEPLASSGTLKEGKFSGPLTTSGLPKAVLPVCQRSARKT